jgi:hypothetical protein
VCDITDVTLKACYLQSSASACCLRLVSTVTGEDRRYGCVPVTHLIRSGRSPATPGPAGLAGLSGSSLPVPPGPGPAILPARPLERLSRTGRLRAQPAALDRRSVRLPLTYLESRLVSRCECVQPTSKRLIAASPFWPGADSSESALLRAEVARQSPASSFPHLPRLGLKSGVSTPRLHQL